MHRGIGEGVVRIACSVLGVAAIERRGLGGSAASKRGQLGSLRTPITWQPSAGAARSSQS